MSLMIQLIWFFELNPKENRLFVSSKLPKWVQENFPKIAHLK